jgi:uncharacterized protein (TIGR03067 family)
LGLEGTWVGVSAEQSGSKLSEEVVKNIKMTLRNGALRLETLVSVRAGTYQIDMSKSPMWLDLTLDGQKTECIFRRTADTLTLCAANFRASRPTAFAAPARSECILVILKLARP